jgi:hypothetical protein
MLTSCLSVTLLFVNVAFRLGKNHGSSRGKSVVGVCCGRAAPGGNCPERAAPAFVAGMPGYLQFAHAQT